MASHSTLGETRGLGRNGVATVWRKLSTRRAMAWQSIRCPSFKTPLFVPSGRARRMRLSLVQGGPEVARKINGCFGPASPLGCRQRSAAPSPPWPHPAARTDVPAPRHQQLRRRPGDRQRTRMRQWHLLAILLMDYVQPLAFIGRLQRRDIQAGSRMTAPASNASAGLGHDTIVRTDGMRKNHGHGRPLTALL